MQVFGYDVCTPAVVYFVISLILILVIFILNVRNSGAMSVWQLVCNLLCTVLCTTVLALICAGSPGLAWVFTGIFILFLMLIAFVVIKFVTFRSSLSQLSNAPGSQPANVNLMPPVPPNPSASPSPSPVSTH